MPNEKEQRIEVGDFVRVVVSGSDDLYIVVGKNWSAKARDPSTMGPTRGAWVYHVRLLDNPCGAVLPYYRQHLVFVRR